MGSCLGTHRSRNHPRYGSSRYPAIGKNQPLRKEHPKWKSGVPLTEGQLRSKRDEFWDTAPAFDGRKEIWDALKAAATAMESGDNALAQAIIDGANIVLPHGTLLDCYDELGAHYQLPVYCLSSPIDLVKDEISVHSDTVEDLPEIEPDNHSATTLRMRLSSEKEVKLQVLSTDSISVAKRRLEQQENIAVNTQRWFFAGKMLTDHMHIEQCKLEKGFVVQCIITQPIT
ncbi:unnamed protein product [Clavelina lepadiformis]|uniref:Ubiquitin-like domain-containing protein n=1 Tax=Clavelina lepadiformis TaxID=159417 RepID=A0ABP0F8V1_CLALP